MIIIARMARLFQPIGYAPTNLGRRRDTVPYRIRTVRREFALLEYTLEQYVLTQDDRLLA
jgi:hypothetical protein